MQTERLAVRLQANLAADPSIARAASVLRAAGLVAFPTETVYGLGARADDAEAVGGIFRAKGRPSTNPLIVHVPDAAAARALAGAWPDLAERLAQAFWPGPLTLIVARPAVGIADLVTAGGDTLALRVPSHPVARALLAACGVPVAAPSANRSTRISPTTADHVMKSLAGRIDVCLDGGPTGFGIESTIVDVTRSPAVLLRHGAVPIASLAEHGAILDRAGLSVEPGERAAAPGSQARHYAPRARLLVVPSDEIEARLHALAVPHDKVGALVRAGEAARLRLEGATVEILPDDVGRYARGLYAALHRLEDLGCGAIVVSAVPDDPVWDAVRDRLRRASAPAGP